MPTATNPDIVRLARLCDESGLTRTQIAERAGMTPSMITRALANDSDPRASTLRRIASAIDHRITFEMEESG